MKYLDYVQLETTRMYGPGTSILVRSAVKDHMLKDIPIKAGIGLSCNQIINHYSSKFYENPFEFKPERWEQDQHNHPYSLCGFSGGPRSCIGKHLAYLESKIGLIKFVMRYP